MRQDTYKHQGLRQQLIAEIRRGGFKDEKVLEAMMKVPRHLFLEKAFEDWAYKNVAFPIGCEQTISQPLTVAIQTSLLEVETGDIILEVGTGSGYQAAILLTLGAKVYTIERQQALFEITDKRLRELGYGKIRTFFGDGYAGLPRFAPFDKILVTAGATEIPEALVDQLKTGGYLVIPVGNDDTQVMWRYVKQPDGAMKGEKFGLFKFVPLLKGIE